MAAAKQPPTEWSAFYTTVNRLGPRLLRRVRPELIGFIEFEARESDAFWSDGVHGAFEEWKSGAQIEAVGEALLAWTEAVCRHLDGVLGEDSLLPFQMLGVSDKTRKELRRSVRKIELHIDPDHVRLFIDSVYLLLNGESESPKLLIQGLLERHGTTPDGDLIRAIIPPWRSIIAALRRDWNQAFQLDYRQWEELVAAAFDRDGFDEVILTPRSGDHGRDVIAVKRGIFSIRIIGSVKAYRPDHLVTHDDVRALAGVLANDPKATKAILTTTSGFAPNIVKDPIISPLMPYRLQLMDGKALQQWFEELALE